MKYILELNFIKEEMFVAFQKYRDMAMNSLNKSSYDLVTDIDFKIEEYLTNAIKNKYPNDHIHGEEYNSKEEISNRTWTIDPIDGTCNMANGIKLYGVQCSLIDNGEIVLGVIYLPHFDELIYALVGKGCYLNDYRRVFVNKDVSLNNALISFGDYPHLDDSTLSSLQHDAIKKIYDKVAKIRMFGASSIDFSFLATGRTHGTVLITKNIWDIAPGYIICKEAGAIITNLYGLPYHIGDEGIIVCSNRNISKLLIDSFSHNYELNINNKTYSFDAIIFDFDGVITDTEKYHYLAWSKALSYVGINLSEEDYMPLKSTGRKNILSYVENRLNRNLKEEEKNKIIEIKDNEFNQLIENINKEDMIKGVEKFLKKLKAKHIKMGIGSSAKSVKMIMDKLELNDYFNVVIDGRIDIVKKPSPDIFNQVMSMLNVNPSRCLIFEDSLSGSEAAFKSKASFITIGDIKDKRALMCIDDFTSLLIDE